jgi:hypothetical protein
MGVEKLLALEFGLWTVYCSLNVVARFEVSRFPIPRCLRAMSTLGIMVTEPFTELLFNEGLYSRRCTLMFAKEWRKGPLRHWNIYVKLDEQVDLLPNLSPLSSSVADPCQSS